MVRKLLSVILVCALLLSVIPTAVFSEGVQMGKDQPASITFGLFSDLHYKEGMYIASVESLNTIMKRANDANADFVMQVGDFSNDWKGSPEIVNAYLDNAYDLPAYGVYGNHELESNNSMQYVTPKLTNRSVVWGTSNGQVGDGSVGYYYYDVNGFRIVCADSNYSYNPNTSAWEHNPTGSYGTPDGNQYGNSFGPVQLAWIESVLTDAADRGLHCIFFSHASVSGIWSSSPDAEAVREIFVKANDVCDGTVLMAINGHLHKNHVQKREGVLYLDMNTVHNGLWSGDQTTGHYTDQTFPQATYDNEGNKTGSVQKKVSELTQAINTWFFTEPLSAVVTVSSDGTIEIEGSTTTWLDGIVPSTESESDGIVPKVSGGIYKVGAAEVISIDNADELKKIGKHEDYPLDGTYRLTADIDLRGAEWTPIGSTVNDETDTNKLFSGIFDGNGKTVSNFKITRNRDSAVKSNCGFFGGVSDGTVKDLTLSNATVVGNDANLNNVAVLVGRLYSGTISGCTVTDDVTLTVTKCSNNVYTGSICGYAMGTIKKCLNNAEITIDRLAGAFYVGGITGNMAHGTVENCLNNADVSVSAVGTTDSYVAGICGRLDGWSAAANVINCVNKGTVRVAEGNTYAGGIAGDVKGTKTKTLVNNLDLGEVSASTVGRTGLIIAKNNAGDKLEGNGNLGVTDAGALCSNVASPNWASYDTEANIKASDLYKAILASFSNGIVEDVIKIATANDLKKIGKHEDYPLNGYYKLTADIDLGGEDWTPIGTTTNDAIEGSFAGMFDGDGHTVYNFTVTAKNDSGSCRYGFFGVLTGMVKDLRIAKATYTADAWNCGSIGSFTGQLNGGTLSGCETAADVTVLVKDGAENFRAAGIFGYGKGTVEYCVNRAVVTGGTVKNYYFGGIAGGFVNGTMSYCVNYGTVDSATLPTEKSAYAWIGGICGQLDNWISGTATTIENCINFGTVTDHKASANNAVGGIVAESKNGQPRYLKNCINLGKIVTSAVPAQLIGWTTTKPTDASGNYGLNVEGAQIAGNTNETLGTTLTNETEIKNNATYQAILVAVADRISGVCTDLYGYQTKKAENNKFDMRLVALLSGDYTALANVGFKVSVTYTQNGITKTKTPDIFTITKLYESITETGGDGVENTEKQHTAKELGGDYVFVLACKGLPADATDITFTVTTFYNYEGNISVMGATKTFTVA